MLRVSLAVLAFGAVGLCWAGAPGVYSYTGYLTNYEEYSGFSGPADNPLTITISHDQAHAVLGDGVNYFDWSAGPLPKYFGGGDPFVGLFNPTTLDFSASKTIHVPYVGQPGIGFIHMTVQGSEFHYHYSLGGTEFESEPIVYDLYGTITSRTVISAPGPAAALPLLVGQAVILLRKRRSTRISRCATNH